MRTFNGSALMLKLSLFLGGCVLTFTYLNIGIKKRSQCDYTQRNSDVCYIFYVCCSYRCQCSICSRDLVVNHKECGCCMEILDVVTKCSNFKPKSKANLSGNTLAGLDYCKIVYIITHNTVYWLSNTVLHCSYFTWRLLSLSILS